MVSSRVSTRSSKQRRRERKKWKIKNIKLDLCASADSLLTLCFDFYFTCSCARACVCATISLTLVPTAKTDMNTMRPEMVLFFNHSMIHRVYELQIRRHVSIVWRMNKFNYLTIPLSPSLTIVYLSHLCWPLAHGKQETFFSFFFFFSRISTSLTCSDLIAISIEIKIKIISIYSEKDELLFAGLQINKFNCGATRRSNWSLWTHLSQIDSEWKTLYFMELRLPCGNVFIVRAAATDKLWHYLIIVFVCFIAMKLFSDVSSSTAMP